MEDKPIKVDKWDGNALKNALDDAAKKILKETCGMEESFRLVDGRLALCTAAVVFALFGCLWDWLYPFPKSKAALIISVAMYFVLTGILTVYLMFVEKNRIFVGLDKDKAGIDPDNRWILASTLKKYDHMYTLELTFIDGISKIERTVEFNKSVGCFFDESGTLNEDIYHSEVMQLVDDLAVKKDK